MDFLPERADDRIPGVLNLKPLFPVHLRCEDYMAAITGAIGSNGEKGENGLRKFEVWKEQQPPKDPDYTY